MGTESKCPVTGGANKQATGRGTSNRDWWPNQLNLKMLHQCAPATSPMVASFHCAEEFKKLDLAAVKKNLVEDGHVGAPDLRVVANRDIWLSFVAGKRNLMW